MKILLTGVTGLVGASVVTELLRNHPDYEIVAICRPGKTQTAQQRVEHTLRAQCEFDEKPESADAVLSRVTTVAGDVTCLPFDELAKYGPYDVMFHCAADVNLGKDLEGKTFATNLNGTKNALEAVKRFHIPVLHYVSTAYVAGKSVGRVMEDDMPAKDFINSYERSKFQAEKLVRECGVPYAIYRPSIVVGRLKDGVIRKPLAFYRILEFFGRIKSNRCCKRGIKASAPMDMPFRLVTETSDKIYFVPIDYVQKSIVALFDKPLANKAYHITGESPVSTEMICEAVSSVLKLSGLTLNKEVSDPTPDERLIMKMIEDLLPYFTTQITFDNTNVKKALGDEIVSWRLDVDFLKKMAYSYYKMENPAVVEE